MIPRSQRKDRLNGTLVCSGTLDVVYIYIYIYIYIYFRKYDEARNVIQF